VCLELRGKGKCAQYLFVSAEWDVFMKDCAYRVYSALPLRTRRECIAGFKAIILR
jgi:hypothetical protein